MRNRTRGIEAQQIELIASLTYIIKPYYRFYSLALGEVILKRSKCAICCLKKMIGFKPPSKQGLRSW